MEMWTLPDARSIVRQLHGAVDVGIEYSVWILTWKFEVRLLSGTVVWRLKWLCKYK
jgi:hypothetical protein